MRRWRIPWLVVTVEGVSMAPTYVSGDRLLVRRTGFASVPRGSAVLLVTPGAELPGNPPFMVKRAVALPGDPVPPGIPVSEAVVPPGRLVVLGDNPGRSADSRFYGFQPADTVIGVVRRRLTGATGSGTWMERWDRGRGGAAGIGSSDAPWGV